MYIGAYVRNFANGTATQRIRCERSFTVKDNEVQCRGLIFDNF